LTLGIGSEGGFKAVFRASIYGKDEAFKIIGIPEAAGEDEEERKENKQSLIKRALREINVLKTCDTVPEIVRLGSLEPTKAIFREIDYIVYSEEFLTGIPLNKAIRGSEKPSESEVKKLLISLLRAINALRSQGIIHRDIKPKNIIKHDSPLRPFVLLDFGIALSLYDTSLTKAALPCPGTVGYMAPEMCRYNYKDFLSYKSDMFCAALTVYEFAAKVHPFAREDDSIEDIQGRIADDNCKHIPLQSFRPDLSSTLTQMVDCHRSV